MTVKHLGRIAVIGASGLIGSAVMRYFEGRRGVDASGYSSTDIDLRKAESVEILGRLADEDTTLLIVSGVISDKSGDHVANFAANVEMAVHVASFLENHRVRKCVYFGAFSVYGDHQTNLAIDEQTAVSPSTYYALGKYASERLIQNAAQNSGSPFLGLRISRVYGPGVQYASYGPAAFIRSILESGRVQIYGQGEETREMVYLDDLCRAVGGLLEADGAGIYNLTSGKSPNFSRVLEIIRDIIPDPFDVESVNRTRPLVDQRCSGEKLNSIMPNFRWTSFEDGLKATYDYYAGIRHVA
ncbi:MAG: NAD(P)-dependent oxidoreductase [Candidatus Omnitrophota bacterium]|nr:NAD(P)-dependent oxidoreductase [Candidatus Omnitrophota bacterium]